MRNKETITGLSIQFGMLAREIEERLKVLEGVREVRGNDAVLLGVIRTEMTKQSKQEQLAKIGRLMVSMNECAVKLLMLLKTSS